MADIVRREPFALAPRRPRRPDRGPRVEYLAFRLADDIYAAPIGLIREILKPPPLAEVPRAPATVLGIISVRGQLVTVIDLRQRLRLPEQAPTKRSRILLAQGAAHEMFGLFVDEVLQVHRFAEDEIEPAAPALGGDVAEHIAGIARPAKDSTRAEARGGRVQAIVSASPAPVTLSLPRPRVFSEGAAHQVATNDRFIVLLDFRAILGAPTNSRRGETP